MRILITGAPDPLGRLMIDRLRHTHELLALTSEAFADLPVPSATIAPDDKIGLSRFARGCHSVIQIDGCEGAAAFGTAMRDARIERIVRVGRIGVSLSPSTEVPTIDLLPGMLLGPGDPWGAGLALRAWAWSAAPAPGNGPAIVDGRDVAGAVESALSRGAPGTAYPLLADCPSWAALRATIRSLTSDQSPHDVPRPLDCENADTRPSRHDLGWWTRDWERTLRDTFANC